MAREEEKPGAKQREVDKLFPAIHMIGCLPTDPDPPLAPSAGVAPVAPLVAGTRGELGLTAGVRPSRVSSAPCTTRALGESSTSPLAANVP